MEPKDIQRFMKKVKKTDNCWIWTACKDNIGYGKFRLDGKGKQAHRFSYELFKEDIPDGLELDHLCRNTSCVNPEHLEPVSHKENILRGVGACAINSKKTHCPKGHPYDGVKKGRRRCSICRREINKRHWKLISTSLSNRKAQVIDN